MELGLNENVVFISGSSKGIGRAIAKRFLEENALVTITGRNAEDVQETYSTLANDFTSDQLFLFIGDLTKDDVIHEAIAATVNKWGRLDHTVANIGTGHAQTGWNIGDSEWQRMINQNFFSAVRLIESAVPHMLKSNKPSISMIGSIAGIENLGAPIPYSSAKAALTAYTKSLANELGPKGIRANIIAPGNIFFPGGTWDSKLAKNKTGVTNYINAEVPLGRFGKPEEIADLVVFLSSQRAEFITGANIVIDGGQSNKFN